jgi:cytochrome c oxidase assembly factor CtaG
MTIAAVVAVVWYRRQLRRMPASTVWSSSRFWLFTTGLAGVVAVTSGPVHTATTHAFYWWVTQSLVLLLILPILLMLGQPVELVRLTRRRVGDGRESTDSGHMAILRSPVFGAALVPLTCAAFLFGPIPGWSIHIAAVGPIVQLALIAIGLLVAFPLVGLDEISTSGAVGVAMAFGLVELLLDAIPGIVMRLSTHPVTNFFHFRVVVSGQVDWLTDQRRAGAILWCVAELLDVPFLIVLFIRWTRADDREAALADRPPALPGGPDDGAPWFLTDPQLRDRFRGPQTPNR